MPGLLGAIQGDGSPEQNAVRGAIAQGLLSANGSQGLGNAMGLLNAVPDTLLKRQDLAQQIQLRNIALQRSQQEWAAIQPALAAYAARQAGGAPAAPGASGVSQPAIAPTAGGALGSGTAGIDIGGQPARSAPPAASSGGAAGAADPFGLDNIIQGRVVNLFGGAPAASAYWDQFKTTDLMKMLAAQGMQPGSPQYNQALAGAVAKANYIAPTRLGQGAYNDPALGVQGLPAPPQPGFQNVKNADGTWTTVPVGNGPSAVQQSNQAQQLGKLGGTLGQGFDANGNPVYYVGAPPGTVGAPTAAAPGPSSPTQGPPTPSMNQSQFNSNPQVRQMAQAQPDGAMVLHNEYGGDPAKVQADIQQITQAITQAKDPTVKGILQGRLNTLNAAAQAANGGSQPAPNAGTTSGVIRPGLSPTQQGQTDLGKQYYDTATKDRQAVPMLRQTLDEILKLAESPTNTFGPGTPEVARIKALANNIGIDLTGAQTAQDVIGKLASNVVMTQLGQGGQTGTDAQMNQIIHATPGGVMTNAAIKQVVPLLQQQIDVRDARANVLQNAVQNSNNFAALPSVANQFNRLASPPIVQLGMQLQEATKNGTLAQFRKSLTPQQQAMLPAVRQLDSLGAF